MSAVGVWTANAAATFAVQTARSFAALWRVCCHSAARSAYRSQLARYDGLFGPWRLASDQARGVPLPTPPARLSVGDYVRANVVLWTSFAVLLWVL